jgi:hypothetical protein
MAEIKYAEKTNFDSLGRSGFTQCHGISVINLHPEVFLEAISSRGTISPVRIPVPLASIAALRDALTAILAEPATIAEIGPDPATIAALDAVKSTFPRNRRSSHGRFRGCQAGPLRRQDCVEHRNMNGGCDICGDPCL